MLDETPMAAGDEDRITVLNWNTLCDKYTTQTQYPYAPTGALAWDYRRELILEEFRARNADIICLQEIDSESFHEYFRPALAIDGYRGLFWQKSRSQTMDEKQAKSVDGCATLYNNNKYASAPFILQGYD